jgi:mannose-6-phosphate isomerase-like protein (cupin superfamily)
MKILLKHQSIQKQGNDVCVITEHPLEDKAINFALAKVSGRYPTTGCTLNHKSKELVYVYEGSGRVVVEDKVYFIQAGDLVLIEPGEKFYWDGTLTLGISCTPAWLAEQNELVE